MEPAIDGLKRLFHSIQKPLPPVTSWSINYVPCSLRPHLCLPPPHPALRESGRRDREKKCGESEKREGTGGGEGTHDGGEWEVPTGVPQDLQKLMSAMV